LDNDGDGYGSTLFGAAILSCSPVAGRVISNTDCDDTKNAVYPGAPELCDGLDNNCNGQLDEGVLLLYYRDVDGDGYGNDNVTVFACSPPGGYVLVGGDCLDNTATVNPGAIEICGDGIDNNCNGQLNEGFVITRYYQDADGDGYGNPSVFSDLCNPFPGYVTNDDDCNDSRTDVNPGAVEIASNGLDDNCNGLIDEPNTWTGTASSEWSNPANWSAGVVPTASTDAVIPANVIRFPVLSADAAVRILNIQTGASLSIGSNTLTVGSGLPGRGVVRGSANANIVLDFFVGTNEITPDTLWMDQSVDGETNALNSLRYFASNGAALPLGNKLIILDYYDPYGAARLFSDGNLVLRSTATKTARVLKPTINNFFLGDTAYVKGDVTVERYIPMNEFQAWRLLSVPVKGTQTIKQAWQENQAPGVVGAAGWYHYHYRQRIPAKWF
jgi:Putative metal-binding motif